MKSWTGRHWALVISLDMIAIGAFVWTEGGLLRAALIGLGIGIAVEAALWSSK